MSSPILIVMRLVRWVINKFFVNHIKNFLKRIVHWFMDNKVKRLAKGQNIFRYYWWLWLLSPILLISLMLVISLIYGLATGINLGFEIWETDVKND